jgi:hypothetical protein
MLVRIARRLGLLQLFLWLAMLWSPVLERFRKRGTRLGARFYRQYLFGTPTRSPTSYGWCRTCSRRRR